MGTERPQIESTALTDVALFALIALGISVITGLPVLLSTQAIPVGAVLPPPRPIVMSQGLAQLLIAISNAGPAFAALIVVSFREGRSGASALLRQLLRWSPNPGWYLVGLVGPTAIGLLSFAIAGLAGRRLPGAAVLAPTALTVIVVILLALLGEIGWRGYAFPTLQARLGLLPAAVITGTIWFLWREWRLITPGGRFLLQASGVIGLFLLLVAASIVIGWMFNQSGGYLTVAWAAASGLLLMSTLLSMQFFQFALVVAIFLLLAAGVVFRSPA
jgi:hypothetical protein